MKKVFVYFEHMALCETPRQAVDFINSLPGLVCNAHTERLLDDLFAGKRDFRGEEIRSLATTGCGKSRIRVYDALGDTLDQHQAAYLRREEEKHLRLELERARLMEERMKDDREKMDFLTERQAGTYLVRMTMWCYDKNVRTNTYPQNADEVIFEAEIVAGSGAEAYVEAVRRIVSEHDVADYVTMTDKRFSCERI